MQFKNKLNIKSFAFILLLFVTELTFAVPTSKFDSLIVFGDSYSDNGNGVFKISNGTIPQSPPYFEGRLSNGLVWAEYLSKKLDLPLTDSAFGAATTNNLFVSSKPKTGLDIPGIRQQIEAYLQGNGNFIPNNKDLFAVFTFGNDYIISQMAVKPEQVVEQFMMDLEILAKAGAVNLLVITLPNFYDIPLFVNTNQSVVNRTFYEKIVDDHNRILRDSLDDFEKDFKVNMILFDIVKFFQEFVTKNPKDTKESCVITDLHGGIIHVCDDPDDFKFWDNVHITTKLHEKLAFEVLDLLYKKS